MDALVVVVAVLALLGNAAAAAWIFESGSPAAGALRRSMRRRSAWAVAVPTAAAALALGVPFLYIQLDDDAAAPFTFADAPAVTSPSSTSTTARRPLPSIGLAPGSTTTTTFPTSPVSGLLEEPTDTSAEPSTTVAVSEVHGPWRVGEGSQAGYRVNEIVLVQRKTTVGRTSQVTGDMAIDDLTVRDVRVVVDMASVQSDDSQRDAQYRGRIMDTDTYPTSEFVLTEPITLERVPPDGEVLELSATGDFTIHGTTRSVTFPMQARRNGGRIEVIAQIPVRWDEYGIPPPSNGFVQVEDHGFIEFLLLFDRDG